MRRMLYKVPLVDEALKEPGRIITWHAGWRTRAHKSSRRDDYLTIVPKEMAGFLQGIGSGTTLYEFLEHFLDEMLFDLLYDDDLRPLPDVPEVLMELRGFFDKGMRFYVREVLPPGPLGLAPISFADYLRRKKAGPGPGRAPRWVVLRNQHVYTEGHCMEAFEALLDAAETVATRHALRLDLEQARNGFRSMLRRRAEANGVEPDFALLDRLPFEPAGGGARLQRSITSPS